MIKVRHTHNGCLILNKRIVITIFTVREKIPGISTKQKIAG